MTELAEATTDTIKPEEEYTPKLQVFREVPGFDPRTLVLSYGEDALDLQFCGCVNKYKKRFSAFVKENPGFIATVTDAAKKLKAGGYQDVDIKSLLDGLRFQTKLTTPAKSYLSENPHDFEFDALPRAYLARKLMMEEPELFKFFELTPVKCKSQCGYGHGDQPEPETEDETDIAGF